MDLSKASTVICLTIIGVIVINVLIYFALRRGIRVPEIDVIHKITDHSRQSWGKDQEDLDELSTLVQKIKQPSGRDESEKTNELRS